MADKGRPKFYQEGDVGGSNDRCPLTPNFNAKKIHEMKHGALLLSIF